ncbi:sepiapterin reductase-like [Babylonia areolata]|uniref:sepiapterin reductase-like n=1 Tax=Babylonia areolata TaxID=304850 RepID=UPI003FD56C2D
MFSKKTICFVTGSSRGLGESIALKFACKLPPGSVIVLLARSKDDLDNVKKRLLQESPHVVAVALCFNQSSQDQEHFRAVFSQTLESVSAKVTDFQQAVLVNNAGTVKPVVFVRNLPDVRELTEYLNINVSGVIALTSEFLKFFPSLSGLSRVIINTSSLAAVQPFKSWAMYCSGKAARDMFFKTVAMEEEDLRVLSYSPGPVETAMTDAIITSEDEGVRSWAKNAKAEKSLLTCDTSINKLVQILEKNVFESGARIDYFDEI